jgi:hypothetical protein
MAMYNIVQTGAKTHEGGVQNGFRSIGYQESAEPDVMREPTAPTPRVTPRKRITDQILEKFFPLSN